MVYLLGVLRHSTRFYPLSLFFPAGQRSDSQALEDMAHYDFLVQLRKASSHHPASQHYHQHHQPPNGSATAPAMYHPGSLNLHDDPLPIWSTGTQCSPEGQGTIGYSLPALTQTHCMSLSTAC